MPASSASTREEALRFLEARFGIPPTAFAEASFTESGDGEIWIASAEWTRALRARRPPGLRALRRTPAGLKPTSAFLVSIGPMVTRARLVVDEGGLRQLLLGRRIPCRETDGYVAVVSADLVFGCGFVADGIVHCLVPTARRRELLNVLDAPTASRSSDL